MIHYTHKNKFIGLAFGLLLLSNCSRSVTQNGSPNPPPPTLLAVGNTFNCALLLTSRSFKCWGDNSYAQLGQDNNVPAGAGSNQGAYLMANLASLNSLIGLSGNASGVAIQQVAVGNAHGCFILQDGSLRCWGLNTTGQLGLDISNSVVKVTGLPIPSPGPVTSLTGLVGVVSLSNSSSVNLGTGKYAVQVSAGAGDTCAVLNDGSLKCWGDNSAGQLGQDSTLSAGGGAGTTMMANLPTIALPGTVRQVSVGNYHVCAVLQSGSLFCWGLNSYGQLGQNSTINAGDGAASSYYISNSRSGVSQLNAVNLGNNKLATQVSVGLYHTCVLLNDGTVKCWGYNAFGQLGLISNGTYPGQMYSFNVSDGVSQSFHYGSGQGSYTDPTIASISAVNLGATATQIVTGNYHSCALLNNGNVKCWGSNQRGQLGTDSALAVADNGLYSTTMTNLKPVNLGSGRTALQIAAAGNNTCAVLDNNTLKCWGDNFLGQLGQDNTTNVGNGVVLMSNLPAINF